METFVRIERKSKMSEEYLTDFYQYVYPVGERVRVQLDDRVVYGTVEGYWDHGANVSLDTGGTSTLVSVGWRQLSLDPLGFKSKKAVKRSSLLSPRRFNRVMGGSRSRRVRRTTRRSKATLLRSR